MLTQTERQALHDRVQEGKKLLDELEPDWRFLIDEDLLDMADCELCILGQLYGSFTDGVNHLGIVAGHLYGFDIPPMLPRDTANASYELLQQLWEAEL